VDKGANKLGAAQAASWSTFEKAKLHFGGCNLHVYTLSYTVSRYVMIGISVHEKCEEQFMIRVRCGSFYWDTASICNFLLELWVLPANFAQQPSTLFIVCIASHFSSCTEIEFATGRVFVPVPTVLYNVVIHSCWQKSHKSHLQVFAGLTWAARKNSNLHNICW
jgi:hypothetical protein